MTETADLAEGTELAGFTIVEEIGRGGMGVVYLAEQASLGRRVALKVITPTLASDQEFRARFERESHHAASIEHPNVIPVFQAGIEGGHVFLAMRYVEGEDLGALLRRGALEPPAAARVVDQIGAALDAAHAKGLVHRDVKPANILLDGGDPAGHAYLTDFGLTKEQAAVSGLTSTGAWVGTVDYAAPEQIDGSGLDARTDVYSLGCVLYEALTGDLPFSGTPTQKMWAHMNNPPPSLSASRPELAADYDPVISRALAKLPDERFPSAGDLGRAVVAAAQGSTVKSPERSVATGVAAGIPAAPTRAAQTRGAEPGAGEGATEPLPPQVPTERRDAAGSSGSGTRRAFAVAAVLLAVAAGIGAAALLVSQMNGSEPDVTQTVATPADPANGDAESGSDQRDAPAPGDAAGPASSFASYRSTEPGFEYSAELPSGNGWSEEAGTLVNPELYETEVRGPDGYFVVVDYTPNELPDPGVTAEPRGEVSHPEFGSATEYSLPESEAYPECSPSSPCVDYIVEDGQGGGWGVIAGGPDEEVSAELAAQVAESISL